MTSARELPQFVRDLLASPPRAGEGVNLYLFSLARVLHPYRSESDILDTLRAVIANCGRMVSEQEIRRAVENSKAAAWVPGSRNPERATPAWSPFNSEQREAVVAAMSAELVDLWEASPVRFENNDSHTEGIIDMLFPGNPLLCGGRSNSEFATRSREDWRGKLAAMQFILPSPMTARTGRTQDGNVSEHTLENTGPRRFPVNEQAAILLHLAERAPMALAVQLGSKSLHGSAAAIGIRLGVFAGHDAPTLSTYSRGSAAQRRRQLGDMMAIPAKR